MVYCTLDLIKNSRKIMEIVRKIDHVTRLITKSAKLDFILNYLNRRLLNFKLTERKPRSWLLINHRLNPKLSKNFPRNYFKLVSIGFHKLFNSTLYQIAETFFHKRSEYFRLTSTQNVLSAAALSNGIFTRNEWNHRETMSEGNVACQSNCNKSPRDVPRLQ